MVQNLHIHFPGKLVFGNGSLADLENELLRFLAKNIYLITIEPLFPQLEKTVRKLENLGIKVSVNTQIIQEPTFRDFAEVLSEASSIAPDLILGIGGGSVLDVAKLVAAQLNNPQSLEEILGIGLLKSRNTKLICIPATSGTGSEVSPNAILVDDENQKKAVISPFLVPDLVIVDPLLTISVPPQITAATGLDALTHCLEAFTNKFSHPFIDVYAREGMRLIAENIVKAVKISSDETAREQVALGSLLGGFCLGPVNTGGVHALSYPLGSMFHLAHGLSNALLLPYVMHFNLQSSPRKYAEVALALGCDDEKDVLKTASKGIEKIKELIKDCGIPARLREVNIPQEAIPQMATDAMKITRLLKNNPREITYQNAVDIYTDAY